MNSKYHIPCVSKLFPESSHTARAFSHSQRICLLDSIPNPQASHSFGISLLLWEVYFDTFSRQKTSPYLTCSGSKFFSKIFCVSPFEVHPPRYSWLHPKQFYKHCKPWISLSECMPTLAGPMADKNIKIRLEWIEHWVGEKISSPNLFAIHTSGD